MLYSESLLCYNTFTNCIEENLDHFFSILGVFEDSLWGYVGFPLIVLFGVYLTYVSRFVQIRSFPLVVKTFWHFLTHKGEKEGEGIPPLKAFFASIGGCVGIGNIVAITSAVQIGGPGALFWVWMTAFAGSLVKYSEVFLGMTTRHVCPKRGFRGGPMYILEKAFNGSKIPGIIFCIFMCLYGVEIYQFSVVTSTLSSSFALPKLWVTLGLLALVIYAERGGIARIGSISSWMMPTCILVYLAMGGYILVASWDLIPTVFCDIFKYAFEPHAAEGGFLGSALLITISQGIRRGCYSSDIGVGYASIIHSESSVQKPARQASLLIFEVFIDTFVICTMSVLIVLLTGTWQLDIEPIYLVQTSLSYFFPYIEYFMPIFIFLLGYSTVITYFAAGMRTAVFLSPKYGQRVYYLYAVVGLFTFSFVHSSQAITIMALVQLGLLILNSLGIWRLRKQLSFDIPEFDTLPAKNQYQNANCTHSS